MSNLIFSGIIHNPSELHPVRWYGCNLMWLSLIIQDPVESGVFCVKREFVGKFLQVGIDKRLQDVLSCSKCELVLQAGV